MHPEHHELNYLVTQAKALHLREYIRSFMNPDDRSVGRPDFSYPVHTLYLDSKGLQLYDALVMRHRNSIQLRLRSYGASLETGVFVETKRWAGNLITKERGAVRSECVPSLLQGVVPPSTEFVDRSPQATVAVENFIRLMDEVEAVPMVQISYLREGYADEKGSARINFDRHIQAECHFTPRISPPQSNAHPCFEGKVMLEMKFIERFPNWFIGLVEHFNLEEFDTSKYIVAMQAVGLASP